MKKTVLLFAFMIAATGMVAAQSHDVNVEKSSIHWVGKKIGGAHDGGLSLKSGSLDVKGESITGGKFKVDMTSITNYDLKEGGADKLIGHLKSADFFDVEKFPVATMEITKGAKVKAGSKATVTGKFTIKGITHEVPFEVEKTSKGYKANIELDRSKFDVRYGSKTFFKNIGDKAIDDIFTLEVELVI